MLDHRILLMSLLAAFLALSANSMRFEHPTEVSASGLVPIEVEPDGVVSGERGES